MLNFDEYREFQLAVLRALPTDIDPEIVRHWSDNDQALAKVLCEVLLHPEMDIGEKPERKTDTIRIVIDGDETPSSLSNMSLEGDGTNHRKMGPVVLERRTNGKLYANNCEVVRYLSPNQKGNKEIQGHKLYSELDGKEEVLNACILDALFEHPEFIPDEWRKGETYFFGTVFSKDLMLRVECLGWYECKWIKTYGWFYDWWDAHKFVAILAKPMAAQFFGSRS